MDEHLPCWKHPDTVRSGAPGAVITEIILSVFCWMATIQAPVLKNDFGSSVMAPKHKPNHIYLWILYNWHLVCKLWLVIPPCLFTSILHGTMLLILLPTTNTWVLLLLLPNWGDARVGAALLSSCWKRLQGIKRNCKWLQCPKTTILIYDIPFRIDFVCISFYRLTSSYFWNKGSSPLCQYPTFQLLYSRVAWHRPDESLQNAWLAGSGPPDR